MKTRKWLMGYQFTYFGETGSVECVNPYPIEAENERKALAKTKKIVANFNNTVDLNTVFVKEVID